MTVRKLTFKKSLRTGKVINPQMSRTGRDCTSNHRLLKEVMITHKLKYVFYILMSCKKTPSTCSLCRGSPYASPFQDFKSFHCLGSYLVSLECYPQAEEGRHIDDLVCAIRKIFFLSVKGVFIALNFI